MAANTVGRSDLPLPDLVIHNIFQNLPTKAAVRLSLLFKKWEGALAWVPILDFDEGGEHGDNNFERHKKFVDNILKKYLELCEREKQKQLLMDKFRLRMTSYSYRDAVVVNNLISLSFKRSVKEVDISLRVSKVDFHRFWLKSYYCLSRTTFLDAKCMTTLTLGYVRIKNIKGNVVPEPTSTPLLPSLKTMALKTVHCDRNALLYLIDECPSIEYLSLISCSFACSKISFTSSTLKLLESKYCKAHQIRVSQAVNLESATIVSPRLEIVILKNCYNLRYMDVSGCHLKLFFLQGCREVEGIIRAPNLYYCSFDGYLKSKFSLIAPRLTMARILIQDTWDGDRLSTFNEPYKHFPKLKDFLAEFGSSKKMILFVRDFKVLMFPKNFRNTFSSPVLPKLRQLDLATYIGPTEGEDAKELNKCFRWMSPSIKDINQLMYRSGMFV